MKNQEQSAQKDEEFTPRVKHITALYLTIFALLFIILMHHWNGMNYICCDELGGGYSCWDDSGPGLFTPSWSQEARDSFIQDCREYPRHVYFDFME